MNTGFQLRLFLIIGTLSAVFASCNESKYLAANETLYAANKTTIQSSGPMKKKEQNQWSEDMEGYLRPKLNSKFFGIR